MPRQPKPGGRKPWQRRGNNNYVRKNDRIRAEKIRVIDPEGKQLGIMSPQDALVIAKKLGLDLIEISPTANPPVCRILDFGKYKYEQSKKKKESKSTSGSQKLKEIKLRVSIDTHDYMTKIRRAEDFLDKGNKLKISLQFRGREMEHTNLGFDMVKRAIEDLNHMGTEDAPPKQVGRNVTVSMSPLPANKRVRKYKTDDIEEDDSSEEE